MSKKDNNMPAEGEKYTSILGEDAEDFMKQLAADTPAPEPPKKSNKALAVVGISAASLALISAASVALVGCLVFAGIGIYNKYADKTAVSSENYEVDTKMLTCYYQNMISIYEANYGADTLLTTYGLDISQPLSEQTYPYDESMTWFDVLMDSTISAIEQQLIIYEAANAAGYTLSEEEQKQIDEAVAETDISGYGNNVTEEDLRKTLEMQALSTSYYNNFMTTTEFSDEEIEAYYEANAVSFQTCGLGGFSIPFVTEDSEEEGLTEAEALTIAEDILDSKNPDEFESKVADYLTEYEGYSETELESLLPTIFTTGFTYAESSPIAEWAFGGAKKNETFSFSDSTAHYVYIMTDEPARDETPTVNVRHILFMNAEDNMAAAEDALAEWESGEATEESFAALANQYSEDGGSNTNGGLYEGVYPGQMVETFNDWCFDSSRKPGDTGIVETEYGVHVMYFSETAGPLWRANIEYVLLQEAYNTWYEELTALYPITVDDKAAGSIDG